MNNHKVGDRVWMYGNKWVVVPILGSRIDMVGKIGRLSAPLSSIDIKPILKVKNGVVCG